MGSHFRGDGALEFRPNGIRFAQELMEILRFFAAILQILQILRISTDEHLRKESSVQDAYME